MPGIFDLKKVTELVGSHHPARVLVIDTNVIMNEPDYQKWTIAANGPTIFVLPGSMIHELEFIRKKPVTHEKADSHDKADKAIKSLARLFKQGIITEGISLNSGWVIGIPSPKSDELDEGLRQIDGIVNAFGRSDTILLLLTKECYQLFESIPVTLITGEWNLHNAFQMQGVPCHLFSGFPIEGIKEANALIKPIDWEQELGEIQHNIEETSIEVEVTLTSKRLAPHWIKTDSTPIILAEGRGIVHNELKNIPFFWTIPFYPQTISTLTLENNPSDLPSINPISIDFLTENNIDQSLSDAIADRLLDCINSDLVKGPVTLQSPESVMTLLLHSEYTREGRVQGEIDQMRNLIEDTNGELLDLAWWEFVVDRDVNEQSDILYRLIQAITRCWSIGSTYKFNIMNSK